MSNYFIIDVNIFLQVLIFLIIFVKIFVYIFIYTLFFERDFTSCVKVFYIGCQISQCKITKFYNTMQELFTFYVNFFYIFLKFFTIKVKSYE